MLEVFEEAITNCLVHVGLVGGTVIIHELGHATVGWLGGGYLVEISASLVFCRGHYTVFYPNNPSLLEHLIRDVAGPVCGIIYSLFGMYTMKDTPYALLCGSYVFINQIFNLLPYNNCTDGVIIWKYINYYYFGRWKRIQWEITTRTQIITYSAACVMAFCLYKINERKKCRKTQSISLIVQ